MTSLLVGALAYSVTLAAFISAAMWGGYLESGQPALGRQKVAGLAVALTLVQALMWMRLGAGLGG
jgi:hypothetical protein